MWYKCCLIVFILFLGRTVYGQTPDVQIINYLHQCADITIVETSAAGNVLMATVDVKINKTIGHCGCTSAVAAYNIRTETGETNKYVSHGVFVMKNSGRAVFVLSSEPSLVSGGKVSVVVGCSGS